jgi:phosphoketolase
VKIHDSGFQGNPVVTAAVSSDAYDVTTWFVCDGDASSSLECRLGEQTSESLDSASSFLDGCKGATTEPVLDANGTRISDSTVAATSSTDCSGTSTDDGTLYVRVRSTSAITSRSASCTYELRISVD